VQTESTDDLFSRGVCMSSMDEDDNEGEIQFTRTILASSASEYRIDGRKATEKDYQTKLKSVGLLVKSRNFLVFQNEVEKVAQKSPMELTELVERISGSEVSARVPCPHSSSNRLTSACLVWPLLAFSKQIAQSRT